MALAVALTHNSRIFSRQQNGVTFDNNRGHNVPSYQEKEILAFLEIDPNPLTGDRFQQKDAAFGWKIEGYADEPICTTNKFEGKAIVSGVIGRIYLDPTMQEASIHHYGLDELTGYPVSGFFVPGGKT